MAPADVRSPATTTTRCPIRLELALGSASDSGLLRVISTLHRRRCRVLAATLRPGGDGCDRLKLSILAPHAHAARVQEWLSGLVDVHHVVRLAADHRADHEPASLSE
jgi:hypothetical protein